MKVKLRSVGVARLLAVIAAGLLVAHVVTRLASRSDNYLMGFGPLFNLDNESNLPTFYSTLTLLLAAVILAGLASLERHDDSRRPYWLGLAVIFFVLAADEAAWLHELMGALIETLVIGSENFFYSWLVPSASVLIVLFLIYGRFLLRLPATTRGLIVLAGTIFAGGVIGLEAIADRHAQLYGYHNRTFSALATAEEVLEMGGIVLFVYALLSYAEERHGGLEITIGSARKD